MGRIDLTEKKWKAIALLLIIVAISWPVLFMDLAKGHDLLFHLQRIEGILQDVSLTSLPVRMQSGWLRGYGYPVSILYGDIFLYIGAFFRGLGFPVITAFRLFMVCINTMTVLISYYSFKTFNKGWVPVVSTMVYTTASYRLVDVYVRSAIGETLAIAFFPAIAACIHLIITEENSLKRWKYTIVLAFAFVSVICSHTLTTSMMLVVLVLFCPISLVLFLEKGERFSRVVNIAVSGILTLLLAAFFILPFLDFFFNAGIAFALKGKNNIQGQGIPFADYFDFICNPFNNSHNRIQRTPGPTLMIALIAALAYFVICLFKKVYLANHRRIVFEMTASMILLIMSSAIFPWNFIEDNVPFFGGILTAIEFPMRYLAFAIVFMSLLAGDLLNGIITMTLPGGSERSKTVIIKSLACIVCLMCVFNCVQICVHSRTYEKRADYVTTDDLGEWRYYAMDFQLENTTVDDLPTGFITEGLLSMEIVSRDSNDFLIACVTGPEYGWIQFPVFDYMYYHAEDVADPSQKFEIHEGENRTVGVLLPANYSGILHVFWREPISWRVSECISVLTGMACLIFLFCKRHKTT